MQDGPVPREASRERATDDSGADVQFKSPASVFNPHSVAIVGASERAPWPRQIYDNLRAAGFDGPVYPVNPRLQDVFGVPCYPDLASLPTPAEHALIIVPAPAVLDVLEVGAAAGLKSATIYAGGIGEGTKADSIERGRALEALIQRTGLAVVGPNCMGGNSPRRKFFGYPNADLCKIPVGSVALASQSGGALQHLAKYGADRGVAFSYLMSSGNEIGLDLADYVNFFAEDEDTRVIALFVEGVRRPAAFMAAAAKALAAGKPIVAVKTGKSQKSRESAKSHTGAIAGDYDVFIAMCERYGVVVVPSLEDMIETLLVFQTCRLPKGRRVGWVTTSGGVVDLLHDYLDESRGVATPQFSDDIKARLRPMIPADMAVGNPIDAQLPSTDAAAAEICLAVAADPHIDMVAWVSLLPSDAATRDVSDLQRMSQQTDKPVVAFGRMSYSVGSGAYEFQRKVGIPYLQGIAPTISALSALAFYGERAGRRIPPLAVADGVSASLDEPALSAALAQRGVTPPRSAVARDAAQAGAAAAQIGFPVAVKISSSQISHKTEVGGVRLNLRSASDVQDAAASMAAGVQRIEPNAHIEGFLVQEMVSGVEMILGARVDPHYGPMIVLGAGGVFVELIKDVTFRMAPVGEADAQAMIDELKAAQLLLGFRGAAACDVDALKKAIVGLSEFFVAHRALIADLEINPLIVLPQGHGVRAVDVRLVRADPPKH